MFEDEVMKIGASIKLREVVIRFKGFIAMPSGQKAYSWPVHSYVGRYSSIG